MKTLGLSVGDVAQRTPTITELNVAEFFKIAHYQRDHEPNMIQNGLMVALILATVSEELVGSELHSTEFRFKNSVPSGTALTIKIEVTHLEQRRATLKCEVWGDVNLLVIGEIIVEVKNEANEEKV